MNALNQLKNLYNDVEEVEIIDLDKLVPYNNHPFNLYQGERLNEMVANIEKNGVITPIIVREIENNKYEILSGHNRVNACKILGKNDIKAIVKENINDEIAENIMIDTNLMQRSFNDLKPSEKAKVLSIKYKNLKKQGKRNDLFIAEKEEKIEDMTDEFDLSLSTIKRFIKINNLIDNYKNELDNKKINMNIALEISKHTHEIQDKIYELDKNKLIKLNYDLLKDLPLEIEADEVVNHLVKTKKVKEEVITIKIPYELLINKYPEIETKKEMKEFISQLILNN